MLRTDSAADSAAEMRTTCCLRAFSMIRMCGVLGKGACGCFSRTEVKMLFRCRASRAFLLLDLGNGFCDV